LATQTAVMKHVNNVINASRYECTIYISIYSASRQLVNVHNSEFLTNDFIV